MMATPATATPTATSAASFTTPIVGLSGDSWGPQGKPAVFLGYNYQPFSRADKLGKVRL